MDIGTEVSGKEVIVETKYPEIVEACTKQNIPLSRVFGRVNDIDNDGAIDCGYPLVDIVNGQIPMDDAGNIMFDSSRVNYAKNLASLHGADSAVKQAIEEAVTAIKAIKGEDGLDVGDIIA